MILTAVIDRVLFLLRRMDLGKVREKVLLGSLSQYSMRPLAHLFPIPTISPRLTAISSHLP